ncbi:Acylglycerol kinase, mitochondrial [Strongyloides ratti]|uniref:Acylglycerol kinase, mitochondrial n=1 Tax=Strongyloides ratti TaxID=34506 RepID=A0A090L998_STRRB|nr:Acylglycerol kinase, mitochondrial [Strongyloides ratti]CEF66361.1 Acylglycerol kinase, mitochondrial [Strongyloides ratti]
MFIINKFKSVGTTLYNHKKKTIFGACLLYLGGNYCNGLIKDIKIRNYYAKEAVKYGDVPCNGTKPRRLTVLVNKMANERKVYDKFKTNVLPLFNLAGLQVTIIHTKDGNEMEAVASALDHEEADCIYVVGGDGTLARVLTGIYKNKDGPVFPIGHFPGGNDNKGLLSLRRNVFKSYDDVRLYCESGMAVIEETLVPVFPVKCEISIPVKSEDNEINNEKFELKTLYSLSGVNAGWFPMVEEHKHKLWYWFGIKRYFTYFWDGLKRFPGEIGVNVVYTKSCPGCKKCLQDIPLAEIEKKQIDKEKSNATISWWRNILGSTKKLGDQNQSVIRNIPTEPLTINEECGVLCNECIISNGIDLIIENEIGSKGNWLKFLIGGEGYNRYDAMKDGWARAYIGDDCFKSPFKDFYNEEASFKANSLEMMFTNMPKKWTQIWVAGEKIDLSEDFNKAHIKVEATKRKFNMYLPKNIRLNLDQL